MTQFRSRKQWLAVVLAAVLMAPAAGWAELKFAVLDVQRALIDTEEAKAMIEDLNREYKPEIDNLNALRSDLGKEQERFTKDSAVLSQSERQRIAASIEEKRQELQFRGNKLQNAQQRKQQELVQQLGPKLEAVLQDIVALEGYDMVMARTGALLTVNPKHDITRRVTEKLNEVR